MFATRLVHYNLLIYRLLIMIIIMYVFAFTPYFLHLISSLYIYTYRIAFAGHCHIKNCIWIANSKYHLALPTSCGRRRLLKQLLEKWGTWINFNQSNEVPFYYPSLQIVPISSMNTPVLRTSLIPHEKTIRSKSQVSWDPKEPWLQSILNTKQPSVLGCFFSLSWFLGY